MKRRYAETLLDGSALAFTEPRPETREADARLARTEALLREANRDRLVEQQLEEVRRRAILEDAAREHARNEGAGHGIHYILTSKDKAGETTFRTVLVKPASAEIQRLMESPASLMTGLMWEELSLPDRTVMLKELGMDTALVFEESVLRVLPQESRDYLLAWQKQINIGEAFDGSLSVGTRAEHLIEKGYLLHSKQENTGEYGSPPTRHQLNGAPGSASYVKAIMGRIYLEWLLETEEHPIEA